MYGLLLLLPFLLLTYKVRFSIFYVGVYRGVLVLFTSLFAQRLLSIFCSRFFVLSSAASAAMLVRCNRYRWSLSTAVPERAVLQGHWPDGGQHLRVQCADIHDAQPCASPGRQELEKPKRAAAESRSG